MIRSSKYAQICSLRRNHLFLGGTLVGECGVTIAVFALLAIIGSLGWLLWEFALLPLFNYLSDADYNEIFKDFDDFVEDIESFATNQTRIISPKLSKFNGEKDFPQRKISKNIN